MAPAVVQHAQLFQEPGGQLSVAMAHEPHLARLRAAEGEVAGRPGDRHAMLLHTHVTRMVTTSYGSAVNRTTFPRPSSTSAVDSRSSARTRCALFTPSAKRQAPAAGRPVAL